MQYDQQFLHNKEFAAIEIEKYLNDQLAQLSSYTDIKDIHEHLNKEYAFVYYMIMFLRYLIVDYIKTLNATTINVITNQTGDFISSSDQEIFQRATEEERLLAYAIKDDNSTLLRYVNQILTWQDELTLDQSRLLALATGITLYTISEENRHQPLAISKAEPEYGMATILYVPGHYRIFVPATHDQNDIITYFESIPFDDANDAIELDNQNKMQTDLEKFNLAIGATAAVTIAAIMYLQHHKKF